MSQIAKHCKQAGGEQRNDTLCSPHFQTLPHSSLCWKPSIINEHFHFILLEKNKEDGISSGLELIQLDKGRGSLQQEQLGLQILTEQFLDYVSCGKIFISGMWEEMGKGKNPKSMLFLIYLVRMATFFPSASLAPPKCHVCMHVCQEAIRGTVR